MSIRTQRTVICDRCQVEADCNTIGDLNVINSPSKWPTIGANGYIETEVDGQKFYEKRAIKAPGIGEEPAHLCPRCFGALMSWWDKPAKTAAKAATEEGKLDL